MAIDKDFIVKNGLQVGGNTQITGQLTAAGLVYPVSDGDYLQGLVTDGAGNISFDDIDIVRSDVTNQSGATIAKGTPVYQTGSAGNTLTIAPSDAAIPSTMPAIGVAATDIQNGDTGHVIHFGYIRGVDTSAFSEGDRIYVAAGGGYQAGRPTGESNVVQFLGVVTKVHATNGSGVVFGGGRSHAVPNLDNGNIFIGDSNDLPVTATLDTSIVPENTNLYFTDARAVTAVESEPHLTIDGGTLYVDTDNNYVGIGDTSPQGKLDVAGNIMVNGTEVISSTGVVAAAQLPTSGVTAGTYGSASLVPVLTVDDKGRITSASTTSVAGVSSFTYNDSTNVLNIGTADGGSFNANIGTIGGSLEGPLSNITVQYGVNYNGTPTQGSFYFDSLNQLWMVYTGSAWVQAVPGGGTTGGGDTTDAVATLEKFTYSIPSTTNSVQGTDDNGNILAYVVDGSQNVEVFVNGIKQVEGAANDYVATTGTAVTFTYNLPPGSVVDVQVFELLTQDAFYLKSETYTKTETNSQISTALTGYLPLTGGTLSGTLNGINAAFTGNLTVSSTNSTAAVFSSAADNQIELNGNNTQWAGIKWVDPNGEDFIWYNGSSSTFAIGGGGSTTAGKKLHVDGGTTIGVSADSVTPPTDGLYIQGALRLGGMQIRTANDDGSLEHVSFLSGSSAAGIRTGGILSADNYAFATPTHGNIVAQKSIAIGRSSPRYSSVNLDIEGGDVMLIGGQTRLHFYRFGSGTAYTYHHIKTNYSWNGSMGSQMFSVRFTGHEYGASLPIDTGLVWYSYGGSQSTTSIGYNGTHACTCYQSSDGKVVMRIQFGSGYYAAWSLSQYTTNQGLFALDILGVTPSNSTTVY